jgi:hypothetical protein
MKSSAPNPTLLMLAVTAVAGAASPSTAAADRPVYDVDIEPVMESCFLEILTYDWDFAAGDHGFTLAACDSFGAPVWEYGATDYVPETPGRVWGTILDGDYLLDAGQRLLSPPFLVDDYSCLVEIHHYIHVESIYDGMNVKIGGEVVEPITPYPEVLNVSPEYYAWCVDGQPGWTGLGEQGALGWQVDCFDLSQFAGQEITLEFDFGSDRSIAYAGWYIAYIKVGGNPPTGGVGDSWGQIKNLFR